MVQNSDKKEHSRQQSRPAGQSSGRAANRPAGNRPAGRRSSSRRRRKRQIRRLRRLAILCLPVVLLVIVAAAVIHSRGEYTFRKGSSLCGVNLEGMTVEEARAALLTAEENYQVAVDLDGTSFSMTGTQLGLQLDETADLKALGKAKAYDTALFTTASAEDLQTAVLNAYTQAIQAAEEQAEEADAGEEAWEVADGEEAEEETGTEIETTRDVTKASIAYDKDSGVFVGVDGVAGETADYTTALSLLQEAVGKLEPAVSLNSETVQVEGEKAADSSAVAAALEEANSYLTVDLTYSFTPDGGETKTKTIPTSEIAGWLAVEADGLTVDLDTSSMAAYVSELASKYSGSSKKTSRFKTTSEGYITVKVAQKGQTVDTESLYEDLYQCISTKTSGERVAPYSAVSEDADVVDFDGNYIEIDLTNQMVYLYKGGELLVKSPCVTGCVWEGHATPTGVFSIFAMYKDRYLTGADYQNWVNYFMPFNGGIGMHDASWRTKFGGDRYLYHGSHGCINMPYEQVKTIYENVEKGYKVIVHGGKEEVAQKSQKLTGTTSYKATVGESFTLDMTALGEKTKLTYTSSDETVAKVNSQGKVTPLAAGSCTIKVQAEENDQYKSASKKVTIKVSGKSTDTEKDSEKDSEKTSEKTSETELKTQTLKVDFDSTTLKVGESVNVGAECVTTVTFKSSDKTIATVDAEGTITAKKAGECTITVKAKEEEGFAKASKKIKVTVVKKSSESSSSEEKESEAEDGDDGGGESSAEDGADTSQ